MERLAIATFVVSRRARRRARCGTASMRPCSDKPDHSRLLSPGLLVLVSLQLHSHHGCGQVVASWTAAAMSEKVPTECFFTTVAIKHFRMLLPRSQTPILPRAKSFKVMADQFSGLISNQDSGWSKNRPPHLTQKTDDFFSGMAGQQTSHLKTGCPIHHMNHPVCSFMNIKNFNQIQMNLITCVTRRWK